MELTDRQMAEAELSTILNEVRMGYLPVSVFTNFIMDNLSEKGIITLAVENACRKSGPPLS
jgi:hypothetical protein